MIRSNPCTTGPPRASVLVLLTLAVVTLTTCDDESLPTQVHPESPQLAISDATYLGGNPGFFFLPPLVPNSSGHPNFDPAGFDASHAPEVRICIVQDHSCATNQPAPFPITYTMNSGVGSEVVRLVDSDEHYIVNWDTDEFDVDDATTYRIQVLTGLIQLGYADVDVINSGHELKHVQTGQHIALTEGRTLPIKFRIEDDAVVTIQVAEAIVMSDALSWPPTEVVIEVTERIQVTDEVSVPPPVIIEVTEAIRITDDCAVGT